MHGNSQVGVKLREFVWVAKTCDFPEGKGRVVNVGHKLVGVFKVDGKFYAVNDVCPHRGGTLSCGAVQDMCVICPAHGMRFDLRTGESADAFGHHVQTYEAKVEGEDLFIEAWWIEEKQKSAGIPPNSIEPETARTLARNGRHSKQRVGHESSGGEPLLTLVNGKGS